MEKKMVSVSIVAANYNNGNYLIEFIESILQSTVAPKEIIVVDDGSTDNSIEILQTYSGIENLVVIRFDKNRGLCHALNAGLKAATGKYILRVDPDDILMQHRIKTQFDYLESNRHIDVLGSNAIYFNSYTGKEILMTNFPLTHRKIRSTFYKGEHGVLQGTTMIKREVLMKFKYLQENVKLEDFDIFSRILLSGHQFASLNEPLLKVRIHVNSMSNNICLNTVQKVFQLRDKLFGTKTSPFQVRLYFWYIYYYRKFLISKTGLTRYIYLIIAIMAHPHKLIKKINSLFFRRVNKSISFNDLAKKVESPY